VTDSGQTIDHIVIAVRDLDRIAARYEALGFTLTPRAQHAWGTANRLVQFRGRNFIELLEIDRPELIPDPDPPQFGFGAFNRDFLARREGFSMLVLQGTDSRADVARFEAAGLDTYPSFDFGRKATLPDGAVVEVAFSLAFATHEAIPDAAFFTCHNRFPENFWKPEFAVHENGGEAITEVVMVADKPGDHTAFLAGFSGGAATPADGGIAVTCGPHRVTVLSAEALARHYPGEAADLSNGPYLAGFVIEGAAIEPTLTASAEAADAFIAWRRP
jgi:hypothetical protein